MYADLSRIRDGGRREGWLFGLGRREPVMGHFLFTLLQLRKKTGRHKV